MGKSILIMGSEFKIADLIWGLKYRFELVVKLIANKYYIDLYHFLSFLPWAIRSPSFVVQTFDLLLISDQSPRSISKLNC